MRFTLKQIEYFVAAGEAGSIALASDRVNISQPSISAAISHLEHEFGVQLFIRHHAQGLSLTPQGLRLFREAKAFLHNAVELQAMATELSSRVTGPLEIGCLVTLYPLIVPELVHTFRVRHPGTQVIAISDNQTTLLERMRRGEISFAITYDMGLPGDIVMERLTELPPFAFVSASHPLARKRSAPLSLLAEEPFLMLDLPLSRDYFSSLFQQSGITPRIGGKFESMEVIRSLVARGDGFSLGNIRPKSRVSLDGRPLSYLSLEGPLPSLGLGLAYMKGNRQTRTAEAFIQLCREIISDAHIPGSM